MSTFNTGPATFTKLSVSGSSWALIGSDWYIFENIYISRPGSDMIPVLTINNVLFAGLWEFYRFQVPPMPASISNLR